MTQQPDQREAEDGNASSTTAQQQQQRQQQQQAQATSAGHGGQGSDSAMKQMRAWEQRRAHDSGGKHRQGAD